MNAFPSLNEKEPLCENDFRRFSHQFSRVLKKSIPTVSDVIFVSGSPGSLRVLLDPALREAVQEMVVHSGDHPDVVSVREDGFLLPFRIGGVTMVAIVLGVDPFIVEKADPGWLVEVRNQALAQFSLLKRQRIDWDTGLLNTANLLDLLEILREASDVSLMLVEIYPKVRSSSEAITNARKSALSLVNFSENLFFTHYLGHGLFALVADHQESISHKATMLLSWLRRDGFPRVHVGCSRKIDQEHGGLETKSLFDEAWQALQVAGKRGPFSFCDFPLLAHPEQHPLRRPSRTVMARLHRRWKNSESFSMIQLQADRVLLTRIASYFAANVDQEIVCSKDDFYVFLDGMDSRHARQWVQRKIEEIKRDIPGDLHFLVGIGSYPFVDFSRTEVVHNCRKALLHAAFAGPGSVAVFDAVSLNISGDHFFQEGDLESAVREYRRGLVCDRDNINLLNSLGVTYAMMEKHKLAHQCFNKVLAIDGDNFMALYNLGLGEKFLGQHGSAISRFEKAMAVHTGDSENIDIKKDLQFQLGKLYCATGAFQKAVDILLLWYKKAEGSKNAGYACRFLGKSFHGLKKNTEAMAWLQRALLFDGFDAEVMSLLGEVYLEQREGDDIVLSLCEKSVELDPTDLRSRLRLAKAQTACGRYAAARDTLRPCLRKKETKAEARRITGLIIRMTGQSRQSAGGFADGLGRDTTVAPVVEETRYYLEADGNG